MHAPISLDRTTHARLGFMATITFAAACTAQPASATGSRADRFALTGSATITLAAPAQSGASFRINARLGSAAAAKPSTAEGYVMTANLMQVPLVCTSDIILSNGFD